MPQYYSRNRNCTPPRFPSESSPFGSPMLTPSPLRQRPLFPTTVSPMQNSDDLFVPPAFQTLSPNPLAPSPQPIAADDDDGSIFLSSGPSPMATALSSQPLLTPARHTHRQHGRTALGLKNLNAGLSSTEAPSPSGLDSGSRIGLGTKRKSTIHNTPLRYHNLTPLKLASFVVDDKDKSALPFDRLAPLPTPKTTTRTPRTKAETDLHLRRQTATLTRLRISDRGDSGDEFNNGANDSGCEIDEDEANTLFLSNARMKHKVPSLGKSTGRTLVKGKFRDEVAEAISPGGHVTKRRARSRPVSAELKQSVRSPKSPSRVTTSSTTTTRPKIRSTVSFPSAHARSSSSSSASEAGSPIRRRRINAVATHMPPPSKLPEQDLAPRPPLSRLESVSSATLFFGPPIPQGSAPTSMRSRTSTLNSTNSTASPDKLMKVSVESKAKRHSYTGLDDLRAWKTIQARPPSPASSPDNVDFVSTDIDDDMDFEDDPPNTSFVLNVTANTPSPLSKTVLRTKYQSRDSGVVVSDDDGLMTFAKSKRHESGDFLFPVARSSTSVSSNISDNDEGLVTPGVAPDSGSWTDVNVFIRGTDDNGRTGPGSLESGVDVDAFIMKTLSSAANGPHKVTKRAPGTPVKKLRTTYLGGDRPWQSAVASKVGPRLEFNEKKAPRKSLPAVFPTIPRHGDKSNDSSDSEGEQDSPSSRKDPKYGSLGLGRPSATDVPLALTRTRWLMRRSSSGAFSSSSESASISTTPTRNKATDWQLPKPRIPAMFSQASSFKSTPERSASGSSNSSTVTLSPTDRSRYLAVSGSRHAVPRARSVTRRSSDFTADERCGRFEREFVELAEVGCGEFGKVIKVRRKTGNDSEVFAIKKSKRFGGVKHRLRLREEVDILQHLSQAALACGLNGRHPNVLAYIDSWEEGEQLFIQTELCESGNLARFLWEYGRVFPRLDEARVWKIISDLSNGLGFIHDAGIIHLDLKPSNIFLTKGGRFKIGDFGMASLWPRPPSTSDRPGQRGGSPERGAFEREGDKLYLAPEVLQGRYGKEADVFSLGMTILETASNIIVPDQGEAWHRLRREDFSQVDLEEESGELVSLIEKMMRTDPTSRITARGIYEHPVVARARGAMERLMGEARREGKSEFAGSPLAGVPPGFLEEILGKRREGCWEMDMSA